MLINSIVKTFSQCLCISDHYIVCFKYADILFFNYTSIKLKNKLDIKINYRRESILCKLVLNLLISAVKTIKPYISLRLKLVLPFH